MNSNLRDEILNHPSIISNNKINPNISRKSNKFQTTALYQNILQCTKFLIDVSLTERIYCIVNEVDEKPRCASCDKFTSFRGYKLGFSRFCSSKCLSNSSDVKESRKLTNLKRYGVDNYAKLEECKTRKRNTCIERYGVEHVLQDVKIRNKIKKTNLSRYGVNFKNSLQVRTNVRDILYSKNNFTSYISTRTRSETSYELQVDPNTITKYALKYNCADEFISNNTSKWERIIEKYLISLDIKYTRNSRNIIPPLELDFYLPDYNIAIEINGNYWHSEIAGKKDKNYHFNKWKLCREQGIDLYSYFEDELIDNFDIIKEKLQYITNNNNSVIGARKCAIQDISYVQERDFLNKHHVQGESKARNKTIGAFYNNELVAVFSWQKKKHYLEITRYACDTKASYPGLFSKMMKYMIKELNYRGDIVSFSNNGHSNGGVYNASGFMLDTILKGSYWYVNRKNYISRENRQKFMKTKIKKMFNLTQEEIESKTEWQLMQEQGYDRIWDSGKIKWLKSV